MKFQIRAVVLFAAGILVVYLGSASAKKDSEDDVPKNIVVGTVEDHPWIIKNDTTTPPKYVGFLIDLMDFFTRDLNFNYTLECFTEIGKEDTSKNPSVWTGAIGATANKKVDMLLAPLNATIAGKDVVEFSAPFINDSKKNVTYALGFPKKSSLKAKVTHLIKKLINQRVLEQIVETWFVENREVWIDLDKKKQITPYF